jgi:hypothetical protein
MLKNNLARHVNEMHRGVVKTVCDSCERAFVRPYMLKSHICWANMKSPRLFTMRITHSPNPPQFSFDTSTLVLKGTGT